MLGNARVQGGKSNGAYSRIRICSSTNFLSALFTIAPGELLVMFTSSFITV